LTHAIKSNFYWRVFTQFTFKINGALSTIPLKFSVNFEECCLRHTFPLKIFCVLLRQAPFFLTHSLQSICLANFTLFMVSHFLWRDYVRRLAPFLSYICFFEVKMFLRISFHNFDIIFYISFLHINFKGNVQR